MKNSFKIASAMALTCVVCACSPKAQNKVATASSSSASAPAILFMTDKVDAADGVKFLVSDIHITDRYPGALDGGIAVVVETWIENSGDKPMPADKAPSLHLIDENGVSYNPDANLTALAQSELHASRKLVSDLNPGLTETDATGFEIAKDRFATKTWHIQLAGKSIAFCRRQEAINGVCPEFMPKDEAHSSASS